MKSVFFRVVPERYESLTGFLIRVAERNRHGGPDDILRELFGDRRSPTLDNAEYLADYCRCTLEEVTKLTGFCRHPGGEGQQWYLAGQWITKEYFVSPRAAAICSLCLQEAEIVRGVWDLTLYVVCPRHGIMLNTTCTSCNRKIAWNRHHVLRCSCGYDLRLLPAHAAQSAPIVLCSIIESHLDTAVCNGSIPSDLLVITRRLTELSLDGLFKTIWFLGHILPAIRAGQIIRGRKKPSRDAANNIVLNAFNYLSSWPAAFADALNEVAKRPTSNSSASYIERLFSSIHRYLVAELDKPETAFIRTAYEHQVRQIWRSAGKHRPLRNFCQQMELDLGTDPF